MKTKAEILKSFLSDASILCSEALECISQLTEQARLKKVSPAQVRSLLQVVHTIKGTATMIEGGSAIVHALHGLETRLSAQTFLESSQNPDWLDLAKNAVQRTQNEISLLQRKEKFAAVAAPSAQGLFAEVEAEGVASLQWFPLSNILHICPHAELSGKSALCVKGQWLPILGDRDHARFGLALSTTSGQVVFTVRDVLAITDLAEARQQGASEGLKLILQLINQDADTAIAA